MKRDLSYTDWLRKLYDYDPDVSNREYGREVTFQVTEFCNLACTYCYQGCKSGKVMTWEVAKRIVDFLFEMYDKDDKDAFINKNTKSIILDFIGGEPMLQVKLIRKICDYFYKTAIMRNHIWAENFMISISSNGTIYFNEDVQDLLYIYRNHMSYSISIDGTKEMHDACRIFPNGAGSFDLAKSAQDDYFARYRNTLGTKATIARANLPYFSTLVDYYVKQGFRQIHANCVFEEEWNYDDAKLLFDELKKTADYILSLSFEVEISFFEENFFHPMDENDNNNWCGGDLNMLAFDPDGDAFPCIRYMNSSLNGEQPALKIGNCYDGFFYDDLTKKNKEMFTNLTRRSQSTDECFYCPIASGCAWCSGWNYQLYGTPNKRCTRICTMHKARSLANVYFWNKKYRKENDVKRFPRYLPDEESLKIISKEQLDELNQLSKLDEGCYYVV